MKDVIGLLDDHHNAANYKSLFLQASERDRLDAWEVAVASTQKARLKSGNLSQPPVAYFRTVLTRCWDMDKDYLSRKVCMEAQGPSPAPVSHACADYNEFADGVSENDFDDESDAMLAAQAIGCKEYSVSCPILSSEATEHAADFNATFNGLPAERRESLLARAEDTVRRHNPAFWLDAKGTRALEKLIQQQVRKIVERESPISK